MNWLAHFVLSPDDDRVRLGNWLPDVLSRAELDRETDPLVRHGMELHRFIDHLTDRHHAVASARARLPAGQRRFAGVILDVVWDHFLSRDFAALVGKDFGPFVTKVETGLLATHGTRTPELRDILLRMVEEGWLRCYGTTEGVELTLRRISHRLSPRARATFSPTDARKALEHGYADYQADFDRLWPQLTGNVAAWTEDQTDDERLA